MNTVHPQLLKTATSKFQDCASLFFALGEETRQKIILMLSEKIEEGMNVTSITKNLHLSRPAISHHLKILKNANVLKVCKKGTQRFYKLSLEESHKLLSEFVEVIRQVRETQNKPIAEST